MFGFLRKPKVVTPVIVERPIPPEHFRYIWTHQLVVMTRISVRLKEKLFLISRDIVDNKPKYRGLFPYVVGEGGTLIAPTFLRCVLDSNDIEKNSVSLEYKLDSGISRKIILRFSGNNPQKISIVKDERLEDAGPLVLIVPKLGSKPITDGDHDNKSSK